MRACVRVRGLRAGCLLAAQWRLRRRLARLRVPTARARDGAFAPAPTPVSAPAAAPARAVGVTNKAATSGTGASARKLEEDSEHFAHATVDKSLSQAIQQARLAKKLTQKELATAIMEKPSIISECVLRARRASCVARGATHDATRA